LGEGETGNFSVNLEEGLVKDWGSGGYEGHVFNVVMDVHGLDFPEALEWIVDELNLNASTLERDVANGSSSEAPTSESDPPDSESPPEPVVPHEHVERWHGRLMGEGEAAQAARSYLMGERGIAESVLQAARIGLAHSPSDYRSEWWIMIPVLRRDLEAAPVVAVKGFGFDPEAGGWKRKDGRKIPRNAGSAALYDLVPPDPPNGPVLVCEGELDALCALSHGFNAVTGTAGAGTFKPEWARYLASLAPAQEHGVVVAFDGDEKGRKGAQKAAPRLHEAGLDVRVASLPDGQDVNDVLTEGDRADLHAYLAQADPYELPEPEPVVSDGDEPEPGPEALKDPLRSDEPLSHCEPIPDEAFEDLPDVLAEPTSWWSRRHKRDVFLTSALGILSGCLPNVHGWWGSDVPSAHGPNLFTCFVAGAAGGKSAGTYARGLAQSVHEQITERAERRIADWQARKKEHEADDDSEPFTEPRPPEQGLWVPANASYAQLLHTLHDNEERGIVFSSEIDTVADALGQDWGNFDSLFRKAYHHEADDQGRRETGNIRIEDPHVSLVLGGTDRQFVNLVGSAENGLYSRLCLYYFDAADGYRSQRPTRTGIDRANRLDALAGKVGRLWSDLDAREVPIKFQLEEHQWATLDGVVEPLHQETQRHGFSHLLSIPRRSGLWAFRIAMILTVLRAHVSGATLGRADTLTPTDEDLQAALTIASTYADHALRFGRARLEDGEHRSPKDLRISVMLANTDEKFTSRDAYTAARAEGIDVTDRTLRDDLRTAADRGLLERIASSGWRKR